MTSLDLRTLTIIAFAAVLTVAVVPTAIGVSLSSLGLAFLMFELGSDRMKGRPIEMAVVGWGISLGLGWPPATTCSPEDRRSTDLTVGRALPPNGGLAVWRSRRMVTGRWAWKAARTFGRSDSGGSRRPIVGGKDGQ